MDDQWGIFLPFTPPRQLSPNRRTHWRAKATLVKRMREDARLVTVDGINRGVFARPVPDERLTFAFTVMWGKGRHRWDGDNLLAALKPVIDGICAALEINDRQVDHAPVIQEQDPDGRGCMVVTVRRTS